MVKDGTISKDLEIFEIDEECVCGVCMVLKACKSEKPQISYKFKN